MSLKSGPGGNAHASSTVMAAQCGASVLRGLLFVQQGLQLFVLLLLHQVVIVGVRTSCFTADTLGTPTP